ncbi:MAG: nuclear transport factor 2 family protein [Solirubrobacterales bacterium]
MSAVAPPWLEEHYRRVDANDFAWLGEQFGDDIEVRFGDRPPAVGKNDVAATLADVHAPFDHSTHRFVEVWQQGHRTLIAFDVTYAMKDGSEERLETFTILDRADGLIKRMKVYIDEGPLRAARARMEEGK